MADDDPIKLAKEYTEKLIDLLIAAKAANENTRHVVYCSSRLVGQISGSYAPMAFKELQSTLLYFSVVRACGLFDKKRNHRVSLHTVINAISNKKTVRKVARETYRYHATQGEPRRLTPEDDPEIRKFLADHWKKYSDERGRKEEQLVYRRVRVAQKVVGRAERLLIKDHLRPFRDNFIAHNLTDSTRNGTQISFILGMENRAIQHAKYAVNLLHLALNGAGFDWEGLEKNQRRYARELWDNLNFELPDDKKA